MPLPQLASVLAHPWLRTSAGLLPGAPAMTTRAAPFSSIGKVPPDHG
jgi:hypothetical protein